MILFFKSVGFFFVVVFFSKFAACVHTPVVFIAYKIDVTVQTWSSNNIKLDSQDGFCVCPSSRSHNSHTHIKMFKTPCVLAYLICGNRGSSYEGRDGGLCNHAVGGDTVRRRVEPDKEQASKKNPSENLNRRCGTRTSHYIRTNMVIWQ